MSRHSSGYCQPSLRRSLVFLPCPLPSSHALRLHPCLPFPQPLRCSHTQCSHTLYLTPRKPHNTVRNKGRSHNTPSLRCSFNTGRPRNVRYSRNAHRAFRLRCSHNFHMVSAFDDLSWRFLVILRLSPSYHFLTSSSDQALDRLVSSTYIHYCTSSDDLSTSSSLRGLTSF